MTNRALAMGLAAFLVGGAGACRPARRPPGPVASALIAAAAELGAAPSELVDASNEVDRIAARVEDRHRRTGAPLVDDLNAVIFDDLKFVREIDDDNPRFFLLPSVIAGRRGSCLGLGAVHLLVAERLGLPLDGVLVPGHFFLRTRDPVPRNIELLRRGEAMPDDWYRRKYGPWPEESGAYFRPLSPARISALFAFNAGNFARRQGDVKRARAAYARAVAEAPDFAEAQASLGLVRQLEGDLPQAEQAYRDAARVRADLPGLDDNLALLERERRAGAMGRPRLSIADGGASARPLASGSPFPSTTLPASSLSSSPSASSH